MKISFEQMTSTVRMDGHFFEWIAAAVRMTRNFSEWMTQSVRMASPQRQANAF